jgi:hypothetical protein
MTISDQSPFYIKEFGNNKWYLIAGINGKTPQESATQVTYLNYKCTVIKAYTVKKHYVEHENSRTFSELRYDNFPGDTYWKDIPVTTALSSNIGLWVNCDVKLKTIIPEPEPEQEPEPERLAAQGV